MEHQPAAAVLADYSPIQQMWSMRHGQRPLRAYLLFSVTFTGIGSNVYENKYFLYKLLNFLLLTSSPFLSILPDF